MARITILMFPEPGHLLPTLRIAGRLKNEGHVVTYVTRSCYVDALRRLGFDARPGFESRAPEPTDRPVDRLPLWSTIRTGVDLWRRLGIGAGVAHAPIRSVIRAVAAEAIVPAIVASEPDLLLCDAKIAAACGDVVTRATGGVPIVALRTELPIGDVVPYPDLVLCPGELELPALNVSVAGRHYCEPSVFVDRPSGEPPGRPVGGDGSSGDRLVFCSLGTQAEAYDAAVAVFNRVVEAFAGRRGYRLVVAAGTLVDRVRLPAHASNIEVHATVDQLRVLAGASLAVLHGGLGGVKEAILAGVPMVIVPFVFDQRPNAERIVAHGLGAMILPGETDPDALWRTAEELISSARIAEGICAMRAVFREAEARAESGEHIALALQETTHR